MGDITPATVIASFDVNADQWTAWLEHMPQGRVRRRSARRGHSQAAGWNGVGA